jgi:hypothetical protein
VPVSLCAEAGSVTMPDSTVVDTWGFVLGDCTSGTAGAGGPVLEVNVGDVVTINLTSNLPAGHTASFELSGLPVKDLGGGQYQFTASRAGTFVYQSPGDAGRQEAMGLYGALIVRPAAEPAAFASSSCSTVAGSAYTNAFGRECVLVLSAIDPVFNADPDSFDMNDYLATYWLINGKAYPDTDLLSGGAAWGMTNVTAPAHRSAASEVDSSTSSSVDETSSTESTSTTSDDTTTTDDSTTTTEEPTTTVEAYRGDLVDSIGAWCFNRRVQKKVAEGKLGRKSGEGFYKWQGDKRL